MLRNIFVTIFDLYIYIFFKLNLRTHFLFNCFVDTWGPQNFQLHEFTKFKQKNIITLTGSYF